MRRHPWGVFAQSMGRVRSLPAKGVTVLTAFGDILPFATVVALSPFTVIAVVLMLLSPRPIVTGVGFTIGLFGALTLVAGVTAAVAALIPEGEDGPSPVLGLLTIALGVTCIVLGIRQWRARPRGDDDTELPKWMAGLDNVTVTKALTLGLLIGGPKPKSLVLSIGAGVTIAYHLDDPVDAAIIVVLYALVASSSALVLVLLTLLNRSGMASVLDNLRAWLITHNTALITIILLVIGTVLIGTGLGEF